MGITDVEYEFYAASAQHTARMIAIPEELNYAYTSPPPRVARPRV